MTSTTVSPYDYIHVNAHWRFTVPVDGKPVTVTANFTSAQDKREGGFFLRGKAVDEYGWWHTGVVLDSDRLPDLERTGYPHPEPEPFPVTVGFEWRHGLIRLRVPDDVSVRLKTWQSAHWHEFPGCGDGCSDAPARGTWMHRALAYLHSVQSHVSDDMPFIEGESFQAKREANDPRAYDWFVTTCGIREGRYPTMGFHFSG